MMRQFLLGFVVLFSLSSFLPGRDDKQKATPLTKITSFGRGEELEYRVNFGFFTVGKANTRVDAKVFTINSRPCYKVDAWGETSDWISWMTHVKDSWGGYLDTANLTPHVHYKKIHEGRYFRDELTNYDHVKCKAEVKVLNKETGMYGKPEYYDIPKNGKDLVSGFMYLRIIDFAKVQKGDTVMISGFYEDTAYNLRIIYTGKEVVHTKVGKIPCYKLVPIMPDNKLFDGENSISVWLSEDDNKIPVKMQAKMFIGHTGLELTSFRGLRNQLRTLN